MAATLQESGLEALALHYCEKVESLILKSQENNYNGLLKETESLLSGLKSSLAGDVAQQFASKCSELSFYAGFLISVVLSSIIEKVDTEAVDNYAACVSFPSAFLAEAAASLCEGLTELNASGLYVDDSFVEALATSSAAKSLKIFRARHSFISDAACAAWAHFPALETIELTATESIGSETLLALSKLPSITHLHCWTNSSIPLDVLTQTLAPGAFPRLAEMNINCSHWDQEAELRTLLSALKLRTNLDQFEDIDLSCNWSVDASIVELHQLCPNLKAIRAAGQLEDLSEELQASFLTAVKNVTKVRVTELFPHVTAEFVTNKLPSIFPKLEDLDVQLDNGSTEPILSFGMFPNLKSLRYSASMFVPVQVWPRGLKSLNLGFMFGEDGTTISDDLIPKLDEFYHNLVSSLPDLESLIITAPRQSAQRTHIELILASLLRLEYFYLYLGSWIDKAIVPFSVDHPRLASIPKIVNVENLRANPGMMPCLRELAVEIEADVGNGRLRSLWSLTMAVAEYTEDEMQEEDEEDSKTRRSAVEPLRNGFFKKIDSPSLRLLSFNATLPADLPNIAKFSRLSNLDIPNAKIASTRDLESVLQALPWLSTLEAALSSEKVEDLSWLRHQRLSRVRLTRDTCANMAPALDLKLNMDTLPALQRFSFSVNESSFMGEEATKYSIDVAGLHKLAVLALRLPGEAAARIEDCPHVQEFEITHSTISRLELESCNFLQYFTLDRVTFGSECFASPKLPKEMRHLVSFTVISKLDDDVFKFMRSEFEKYAEGRAGNVTGTFEVYQPDNMDSVETPSSGGEDYEEEDMGLETSDNAEADMQADATNEGTNNDAEEGEDS